MPIPYMWSKAKSAIHIYNIINAFTKDRKQNLLVELFTGWFAVWEVFIQKWWDTIANDKNKYVMALLEKAINWLPEQVYDRVSREKFFDVLKNPSKYEDWYVWYVQTIWSFWNNQKYYLYWKDIEQTKKSADDLVVRKIVDETIKKLIPKKYIDWILSQKTIGGRRMALVKVWKKLQNKLHQMPNLQSLERLQRLERLEKLKKISKNVWKILNITTKSYEEVEIPENAVVYCDPPYKNTATYAEWGFNHDKFWDYIRKLSKTNKVFVSEYTAPDDFKVIYEFSQKSTLQWGNQSHNNQPKERLFLIK